MKADILSPREAASRIPDGATIALTGSGGGLVEPDEILAAIEERFLLSGHPKGLTLVHALGLGDRGARGTNRFAHEGMVRRVIGGHWTWSRPMQELAKSNKIEAYSLPSGVISLLHREIGAGRPGLFTKTGLGTFVDPRLGGGKVSAAAKEDLVELVMIDGEEYLRYRPFRVDVGIIRGTGADRNGNLTAREEPSDLDIFAIALAASNCGGQVIAQVRDIHDSGSLAARDVAVPGGLISALVRCPEQLQTYRGPYNLSLAGLARTEDAGFERLPPGPRRIVALRGAEELVPGATINFGFGMSAGVAGIIAERGNMDLYRTTIEQGIHGGVMETGDLFGMAVNPTAIISAAEQFDIYHGGGLDIAFLGMAELDGLGNVNVSHLGGEIIGPGGFIDITQNARKVVFCGTFEAKGVELETRPGELRIKKHGKVRKLVDKVAAITFSGDQARLRGQEVVFVTERAVFRLVPDGVELIEHAAGISVEDDIIARMGFVPIIRQPQLMKAEFFQP